MKKLGCGCAVLLVGLVILVAIIVLLWDTEELEESIPYAAEDRNEIIVDVEWGEPSDAVDYTVLVYMNGSDLESDYDEDYEEYTGTATSDLIEMIDGLYSSEVRIIIETGGTLAWGNEFINGEENQRWMIEDGELVHLADLGPKNIGEAQTLADFVAWGVTTYPADKHALIFWNHGGGSVLGFGYDEWFDGDSLSLDEIGLGLEAAYNYTGVQFELIGFDACLMATLETAHMLSPYGRYMVASQELEPGHGWDYTAIAAALSEDSSIDGGQLGQLIVDSYKAHAEYYEQEKMITLSVIDLSWMSEVVEALEDFVMEAGSQIAVDEKSFYSFANGRSRAEDYGVASGNADVTDMVDLMAVVRNVADAYPQTAYALESALKAAVVYNMNSIGRPAASGLSIYFPHKDKDNFEDNLEIFQSIGFSDIYNEFLKTYISGLRGEPVQMALNNKNRISFTYHGLDDENAPYEVRLDPEVMEQIEQIYAVVAMIVEESESTMIYLGYDHYVDVDWDTGVIRDDFTGEWLMWDGNFVLLDLVMQSDDYIRYAIPAILNGKDVDILVHFDIDSNTFEVLGAWAGIGETSGMPDKNIMKIRPGDVIIPQFYYYDEETEEEGYVDGDAFTVGDTIDLEYDFLPDGNYLYGFSIVDYGGNETLTDFVEIVLEE
jgi:hypothetical protein